MRRAALVATLVAAAALATAGRGDADSATLPYPSDIRVAGDEGEWQAHPRFTLEWTPAPGGSEVAAVGYRLRNPSGTVLREARRGGDRPQLEIQVPSLPGAYTAEVWMEASDGDRGPAASVLLRYDHARPGSPRVAAPAGWIAGGSPIPVQIEPPPGPVPVSGIGGYAVSIDRDEESWPCAERDRCREPEIDLRGAADGTLLLGPLPEGTGLVRVVAVSGAGVPSAEAATALVRVDATSPVVKLTGAPGGWVDGPVRILATATDAISGMTPAGPNGPFTALAVDGGVPRTEPGSSAAVTVMGEGLHRVDAYARDLAGNDGSDRPQATVVAIDETAPRVHFADRQDPEEPERIEATVADGLSGADPGRGSIAVREADASQPWRSLRTTVEEGRLVARWDSGAHPEGIYEFRATGYDRAGNVATSAQRENRTRMVLVNPLKVGVRLQAGLADGSRPAARVPYGRGAVFRGRLSAAAGTRLQGLPVQVVERFGPGAATAERASKALTAADGSFVLRLPPGPSRQVEARFAGTRTLGSAEGGRARLEVLGAVGFRASAATARVGGGPIVFSGRVGRLGARVPKGGVPVELRFRVPGGRWAEFRTVQTDARGRFRYAYVFADDDSRGVRFRFRAYISGGGWPYSPAASRAVSVTGR